MFARWFILSMMYLPSSGVWATEEKPIKLNQETKNAAKSDSFAEQIAVIKKEHQERKKKFFEELRAAKDDKAIWQANEEYNKFTHKQASKLMTLIREHGKDPVAFEGILVVVGELNCSLTDDLRRLVLEQHLANAKMGKLCFVLRYQWSNTWPEKLFTEVAAKHPQQAVRGQAVYALADYYRERAQPPQQKRSEEHQAKYFAEAARYYSEVVRKYADARTPDGKHKLGDKAATELIRLKNIPNLKIGKVAPDIEGEDLHGEKMRLSDYRGKVVLLDFWGHW